MAESTVPFIPYYRISPVNGTDKGKGLVFDAVTGEPTIVTLSTAGHTHANLSDLDIITGAKITSWDAAATASHSVDAPNNSHYLKAELWTKDELDGICPTPGGVIDVSWLKNLFLLGQWEQPAAGQRAFDGDVHVGGLSPLDRLHITGGSILLDAFNPPIKTNRIWTVGSRISFGDTPLNTIKSNHNVAPVTFTSLGSIPSSVEGDTRVFNINADLLREFPAKYLESGYNSWEGIQSPDLRSTEVVLGEATTSGTGTTTLFTYDAIATGWQFFITKVIVYLTSGNTNNATIRISRGADNIIDTSELVLDFATTDYMVLDFSGISCKSLKNIGETLTMVISTLSGYTAPAFSLRATVIGTARRL